MGEKKMKRTKAAFGAAAVAFTVALTPTAAQAATEGYQIYPTPQSISYGKGTVDFEGTVNTVVESGLDSATLARLGDTTRLAGLSPVAEDAPVDDGEGTEILVGIEGSGGSVDKYLDNLEKQGKVTLEKGLFAKDDGYFLGLIPAQGNAPDRIVVVGRDTDAAFYGLTTLYQVFQQDADGKLTEMSLSDWADVETRGFIEGYYGNPWSTQDRVELMRWGGYYKLNAYIYAPKDDPKHNAQWRDLYTDEEIENTIKSLAEAGNASKCKFVYALHPFMNDPIQFGSTYEQDLATLKAKYLQVIDAGCRQIMLSADDATSPGSSNYIKLLTDLTSWLHTLQSQKNEDGTPKYEGLSDVIPFVEANYANAGASGSWYKDLPSNVRSITTGTQVWGKADNSTISRFTSNTGVAPFMWINWPCTDNTRDHLSMGGYENALGADVTPGSLQGCVINPMQQAEPSKAGLFMNADFSWNNWENYDHADQVWHDSFSYLDNGSPNATAASDALRTLSEHMKWYQGGGVTFESRESEAVKPLLDAFRSKLADGSVTEDDIAQIEEFFTSLSQAAATYSTSAENTSMREEIDPWLGFWSDGTQAALRYLKAVRGHLVGDDTILLSQYTQGKEDFDNALLHSFPYVDDTQYARAGTRAVWPVVEALGEYLKPLASDATGTVDVSVEASMNGLATTNALANLTDGDRSTTVHFSGSNATTNVNAGDSFTLTYAPYMTADTLTFVQSVPSDRPQDQIKDALVEYTNDGSTWKELGHLDGRAEQTLKFPEQVQVKALRFTNKSYYSGYWQVNEVELSATETPQHAFDVFATTNPTSGTLDALADDDTKTGASFTVPVSGMSAGFTYRKATDVGTIAINQGEHALSGTIEGRVQGSWKQLGTFKATASQTINLDANTTVTGLRLNVEGEGIWDLNEISCAMLPSKVTPTMNSTMAEYETFTLDKMTDGNVSSYAHLKNSAENNIRAGDWVGLSFAPAKRIGSITFVQDANGDCIVKGKVEYQDEAGSWHEVGTVDSSSTQTITFPNVNAQAIRVVNLENTAKWWKIYELSADLGEEGTGGSIVSDAQDVTLSGTVDETSGILTGGNQIFEPGTHGALDLGAIKGSIQVDAGFVAAAHAAGLQVVYSVNGLGWTVSTDGAIDAARYVGVRNPGASNAVLDFAANPMAFTFAAGTHDMVYTGTSVEGHLTDAMTDGALNTYWRPADAQGTLTYLVSDPLSGSKPRAGVKIVSWGEPAGASVRAKVYTSEDYTQTATIDLGTLKNSVSEFSFSTALKARAAGEFYGVESVSISWANGSVPSIAEIALLDTVSNPDNNPGDVTPEPADKTSLKVAIDDAVQLVEADYTPQTWSVFAQALATAQAVYNDATATQDAVDSATTALAQARAGLVRASDPIQTHTVTFNFNEAGNKSTVVKVTVVNGDLVDLPTDIPVVKGYTFAGWFYDTNFTKPFDQKTPIVTDTVLYGGWYKDAVGGSQASPKPVDPTQQGGMPATGDMAGAAGLVGAGGALAALLGVFVSHRRSQD